MQVRKVVLFADEARLAVVAATVRRVFPPRERGSTGQEPKYI